MDAIVYTSHTGSTERYARLLGRRTGLPVWPLAEAERALPPGAEIVYLGWLLCGGINGYRTAAGRYCCGISPAFMPSTVRWYPILSQSYPYCA